MNAVDIAEFSEADQRSLYDQLSFKFASQGRQPSPQQEASWGAILRALGLEKRAMPLPNVIERMGRAKFELAMEGLQNFISDACGVLLKRPERTAVEEMAIQCLIEYLEDRDIPVTPMILLRQMAFLPHAVDRAYPGYADAKMLHRVAKIRKRA
jgi:hypothetical protein